MKTKTIADLGTLDTDNLYIDDNCLDVCIDIVSISPHIQDSINNSIAEAKENYKQFMLANDRTINWNDESIIGNAWLNIVLKDKDMRCSVGIIFTDKIDKNLNECTSFDIDLNEHSKEIKELLFNALLNKFF